jgi:hypothetical protein
LLSLLLHATGGSLNALVPREVRDDISDSVTASNNPTVDDRRGGFHEEGGIWGTTVDNKTAVFRAKPGPYTELDEEKENEASIDVSDSVNPALKENLKSVDGKWHVHPKGERIIRTSKPGLFRIETRTIYFIQDPSGKDKMRACYPVNIVVGARNQKVYFYNTGGTIEQMSLREFLR